MLPFNKCPVCGGEITVKRVEKIIKGGNHTATVAINAEVCLHCGERLYSKETIEIFEQIRAKLENNQVNDFREAGKSYLVQTS
ncbi:MAG TPA: YgiT-type zinc finger protein [bacterium]|nr:YgiT-type zinc finger protein [bacterium]HPN45205.1 YgiT-type zinc finger protein [bacterium]